MLLQLNRNKILYSNILRRPDKMLEKLRYELRKHLAIRLDGLTLSQVARLDDEAKKIEIPKGEPLGKRKDHDSLPERVQAYWSEAHGLLGQMRSLHEKLKLMSGDEPCDRYPFLKELISKHKLRRELYEAYDSYREESSASDAAPAADEKAGSSKHDAEQSANAVKAINAARSFISMNKKVLAKYIDSGMEDNARIMRTKLQERYDLLKSYGCSVDAITQSTLSSLGVEL